MLPERIYSKVATLKKVSKPKNIYQYYAISYSTFTDKEKMRLFNKDYNSIDEIEKLYSKDDKEFTDDLEILSYLDIKSYIGNHHVQRTDQFTMYFSIEGRFPFLDHNLIEFSYKKVPYDLKLHWKNNQAREDAKAKKSNEYSEKLDVPKYLIREASYKYLPKEIVERKKVGFPVPLTEWFENLEALAKELLPKAKWLKKGVVNDLINKSKTEQRAGQILWMFINIELFRKKYFEKDWKW